MVQPARRGQVLPCRAVVTQHDAVEAAVVNLSELRGPRRVLPHPLREPFLQRLRLGLRGRGLDRVDDLDRTPVRALDAVPDLDAGLVHRVLGDLCRRHHRCAPLGGGQDAVAASLDLPPARQRVLHLDARVVQDLREELAVNVGRDPHAAKTCLDLIDPHRFGLHQAQRVDVDLEAGVLPCSCFGLVEPDAHIAGEILGCRHDRAAGGIVVDQGAELRPSFGLVDAQQAGDERQVDTADPVHRQRDRLGGIVSPLCYRAGCDHALDQQRRRPGGLLDVVEHLERHHDGAVRILAQQRHDRRRDPRHARLGHQLAVGVDQLLARERIGHRLVAARRPQREPVERTEPLNITLVEVPQLVALLVQLGGVLPACRLRAQECLGLVAQAEQSPQLRVPGLRDR